MRRHRKNTHHLCIPHLHTSADVHSDSDEMYKSKLSVCASFPSQVDTLSAALVRASANGRTNVVSALLAEGADVHYKDDLCIVFACEGGHCETVSTLIAAGANVDTQEGRPITSASFHCHRDVVVTLLAAGASVPSDALHIAVCVGRLDIVQDLVSAGCDIHAGDERALRWAVWNDHTDIANILLAAGANVHNATRACGANQSVISKLGQLIK